MVLIHADGLASQRMEEHEREHMPECLWRVGARAACRGAQRAASCAPIPPPPARVHTRSAPMHTVG
eukprot:3524711-Rhodomonas_salina.1